MSTELALGILLTVQTIALAWIAAWQARAASEVRKFNGTATDLHDRTTQLLEVLDPMVGKHEPPAPPTSIRRRDLTPDDPAA